MRLIIIYNPAWLLILPFVFVLREGRRRWEERDGTEISFVNLSLSHTFHARLNPQLDCIVVWLIDFASSSIDLVYNDLIPLSLFSLYYVSLFSHSFDISLFNYVYLRLFVHHNYTITFLCFLRLLQSFSLITFLLTCSFVMFCCRSLSICLYCHVFLSFFRYVLFLVIRVLCCIYICWIYLWCFHFSTPPLYFLSFILCFPLCHVFASFSPITFTLLHYIHFMIFSSVSLLSS